MNSLESIWYRYENKIITEKEAMEEFFKLKETECDKQSQFNRLIRNISEKFQKEIDKESDKYLKSVYYENETEEQQIKTST